MPTNTYHLLDSGNQQKLEQVGPYLLDRPCPQAVWPKRLPDSQWDRADAVYIRNNKGGGHWEYRSKLPEKWTIEHAGCRWIIKPTGFGHLGIFPEQADNWQWLERRIRASANGPFPTLNLFAYTGGSSMAMARGGAQVTHVDASRGVVGWARENADGSGCPGDSVRWIVDDAMKFCHRELRRENLYRGIVLDPPSFGRGPTGQFWKIEEDLLDLLQVCGKLTAAAGPALLLFSCHSPGFSPKVMDNLVRAVYADGSLEVGEMTIPETANKRVLPAGVYARWWRD